MHLERELRWLRAYALVTYPFACVPFLFLFFTDHGMDAAHYGEILTVYYFTMFVAEVPTGMLADRTGPKRMLVLGPMLLACGFATFVLAPHYTGFLIGEIFLGLGHSVLSGPPTVVLYETLRRNSQEHRYLSEESKIHSLRLYGTGASFLLGGALVYCGNTNGTAYVWAIIATSALHILATVLATKLTQPRKIPTSNAAKPPTSLLQQARLELNQTSVRWLLLYWVLLFCLLRFPFHNYQPYLKAASEIEPIVANAIVIGAIFALLNLVAAPLSAQVPRMVARWGRLSLFWIMPIALCLSIAVMAFERYLVSNGEGSRTWCWIGIAMFFVQQVPYAMHWPLLHEFVNHRIGSHARTTVLSIMSLGSRATYALVNMLLFNLQSRSGLCTALFTIASVGLILTVVAMCICPPGLLRNERTTT